MQGPLAPLSDSNPYVMIGGQKYVRFDPNTATGSAGDMATNELTGSFPSDILNQLQTKWDPLIGNSAITGPDGAKYIPAEIANKIGMTADAHRTSVFDYAPLALGAALGGYAAFGGAAGAGAEAAGSAGAEAGGGLTGGLGGTVGDSGFGLLDNLFGSGIDFAGGTVNGIPVADGLSYAGGGLMGDGSLGAAFPGGVTGAFGDYAGAPFQPNYNLFDPSTYGGSSSTSFLDQLQKLFSPQSGQTGTSGASALSKLLGGGAGSAGSNGLLGTLLSTGPALGAIAYAQNQQPFDTSKLENAYNQISPNSLALPYDIQTGTGRNSLTSSLTDRGVMGSSFANQDLSSYDTLRQLGRQNILTTGATSQANIANQILQANIASQKNKNDLYGRALLAMSGGLSPQKGIADLLGSLG